MYWVEKIRLNSLKCFKRFLDCFKEITTGETT